MQLSVLSSKNRDLQHWGRKNKIDSDIGPRGMSRNRKNNEYQHSNTKQVKDIQIASWLIR